MTFTDEEYDYLTDARQDLLLAARGETPDGETIEGPVRRQLVEDAIESLEHIVEEKA